jgi:hypothetical protein
VTNVLPHFEVDRDGLAKLLERRGKAFAVTELVQNAWDQDVTRVEITLDRIDRSPFVKLTVTDDDPEGFSDLAHAYTLFAESEKKSNPEQRGRFNLGEKLVLALCRKATIESTKGTVRFDERGRSHSPAKLRVGSIFTGEMRMSEAELREAERVISTLIVPRGIATLFNGQPLHSRNPVASFDVTLPTEKADDEGYLRPTKRVTSVEAYEPLDGETATLYELGIPVVETGDRFHVNVMQKVPLNTDRDNVTPSYLRDVRAHVLNMTAHLLDAAAASEKWVDDALADDLVSVKAVERALVLRFGEKRVVYDPSDQEANRIAAAQGYTVIPGASFGKEAWRNIREAKAALPAGRVTPSPKPFEQGAPPLKTIPRSEWTPRMAEVVEYARTFAEATIGYRPRVILADDDEWGYRGTFGGGELVLNLPKIMWVEPLHHDLDNLLIHEFAHEHGGHLSHEYDAALSMVGAKAMQAIRGGKL